MNSHWYQMTRDELFTKLKTDENGLTNKEANLRLEKYGKNTLPKKKKDSVIKIFFNEFKNPILILLLVAVIASLIGNEPIEALAIILIVLVDVSLGTYQENKANNTAEALSKLVTVKTKVLRNGKEIVIDSANVVPGDYIFLESGDKISADLRIIEAHNFTVDESILTGESLAVNKHADPIKDDKLSISDQKNMLFSGTSVVTGRAKAIVVATALKTELGKIADTINNTKEELSPLTIRVNKLSSQISILVIVVALLITILLISKGMPYNEIFLSVVALAVSAMPEGLPLALTMALTIASNHMAKKQVVAKKLYSVESLGSCTVIASDKTGTLTVNEQTAKKILLPNGLEYDISGVGYEIEGSITGEKLDYAKELALLGTINNEATLTEEERFGDSIDIAFLVLGRKANVKTDDIKIIDSIPYESENKYSAVFYEKNGETYCTIKGSLEKVLEFCSDSNLVSKHNIKKLNEQNEGLAKDGLRVITLANGKIKKKDSYKESDIKDLTFMGMVGFIDPIRKEVVASIDDTQIVNETILECMVPYKHAKNLDVLVGSQLTFTDINGDYISSENFVYLVEVISRMYDIVIVDTNSSLLHLSTIPILKRAKECYYIINLDYNNIRNNLKYREVFKTIDIIDRVNYILNESYDNSKEYEASIGSNYEPLMFTKEVVEEKYFELKGSIPAIPKAVFLNRLYSGIPVVLDEDVPYTEKAKQAILRICDKIHPIDPQYLKEEDENGDIIEEEKEKKRGFAGLFSKKKGDR